MTRFAKPVDFFSLYTKAVLEKDAQTMKELYDENVVMYDMWNEYSLTGKVALSKMIDTWFESLHKDTVIVEFSNIQVTGNSDTSFAFATIMYKGLSSEKKVIRSMKNRITICMEKKQNTWKVLHQHTSVPVNSSDTKGIFE